MARYLLRGGEGTYIKRDRLPEDPSRKERSGLSRGSRRFFSQKFLAIVEVDMSRSRSFRIKSQQTGDVAVLQCAGRIVRGEPLQLLRNSVTSLPRVRVIVLDLSRVDMLDCGGLGMLVFLQGWSRRNNGIQLKLVDPSNFARELLQRTGLTHVLHISSMGDAMAVLCESDGTGENVTSRRQLRPFPSNSTSLSERHKDF